MFVIFLLSRLLSLSAPISASASCQLSSQSGLRVRPAPCARNAARRPAGTRRGAAAPVAAAARTCGACLRHPLEGLCRAGRLARRRPFGSRAFLAHVTSAAHPRPAQKRANSRLDARGHPDEEMGFRSRRVAGQSCRPRQCAPSLQIQVSTQSRHTHTHTHWR